MKIPNEEERDANLFVHSFSAHFSVKNDLHVYKVQLLRGFFGTFLVLKNNF